MMREHAQQTPVRKNKSLSRKQSSNQNLGSEWARILQSADQMGTVRGDYSTNGDPVEFRSY